MCSVSRNSENIEKGIMPGAGNFDIPNLDAVQIKCDRFIGFNAAKGFVDKSTTGIHFFVDDYQFMRLWRSPETYLSLLQQFNCVCTPDFSLYTDFPVALQIYNHYRKHWLGAYWQQNGITVIPTISWSDEKSFDWCFDGEPVGGAVAISSVGTQKNKAARALFLAGYKEMMRRLQPSKILFYGKVPAECDGNIVQIESFQETIRRRCNGR